MPVRAMEVRQMMGRAGRPGYDPYGEGIVIAKSPKEEQLIIDRYILGDVEPVTSRLAVPGSSNAREDPALLTHILALIATGGIDNRFSLSAFLSMTFLSSTIPKEDLEESNCTRLQKMEFRRWRIDASKGHGGKTDDGQGWKARI